MAPGDAPFPVPVLVAGPPCSGKTTCGMLAAVELGMPFRDLDSIVEAVTGSTAEEVFARQGEAAFRRIEAIELERCLVERPACLTALGGGALLDGRSLDLARASAVIVTLTASIEELQARLSPGRPLSRSASELAALLSRRRGHYDSLPNRLDTTGMTAGECASEIVRIARSSAPPRG